MARRKASRRKTVCVAAERPRLVDVSPRLAAANHLRAAKRPPAVARQRLADASLRHAAGPRPAAARLLAAASHRHAAASTTRRRKTTRRRRHLHAAARLLAAANQHAAASRQSAAANSRTRRRSNPVVAAAASLAAAQLHAAAHPVVPASSTSRTSASFVTDKMTALEAIGAVSIGLVSGLILPMYVQRGLARLGVPSRFTNFMTSGYGQYLAGALTTSVAAFGLYSLKFVNIETASAIAVTGVAINALNLLANKGPFAKYLPAVG